MVWVVAVAMGLVLIAVNCVLDRKDKAILVIALGAVFVVAVGVVRRNVVEREMAEVVFDKIDSVVEDSLGVVPGLARALVQSMRVAIADSENDWDKHRVVVVDSQHSAMDRNARSVRRRHVSGPCIDWNTLAAMAVIVRVATVVEDSHWECFATCKNVDCCSGDSHSSAVQDILVAADPEHQIAMCLAEGNCSVLSIVAVVVAVDNHSMGDWDSATHNSVSVGVVAGRRTRVAGVCFGARHTDCSCW
jgi:hypothetical protein